MTDAALMFSVGLLCATLVVVASIKVYGQAMLKRNATRHAVRQEAEEFAGKIYQEFVSYYGNTFQQQQQKLEVQHKILTILFRHITGETMKDEVSEETGAPIASIINPDMKAVQDLEREIQDDPELGPKYQVESQRY